LFGWCSIETWCFEWRFCGLKVCYFAGYLRFLVLVFWVLVLFAVRFGWFDVNRFAWLAFGVCVFDWFVFDCLTVLVLVFVGIWFRGFPVFFGFDLIFVTWLYCCIGFVCVGPLRIWLVVFRFVV